MDSIMSSARQIQFLVVLLISLGIGAVAYKHLVLGFPLISNEQEVVWNLETKITFDATSSNARLMFNLPETTLNRKELFSEVFSPGYQFELINQSGTDYGMWSTSNAVGKQTLYIRSQTYFLGNPSEVAHVDQPLASLVWEGAAIQAAKALLLTVNEATADSKTRIRAIALALNRVTDENAYVLLNEYSEGRGRQWVLSQLLMLEGYETRLVQGVLLEDMRRKQSIHHLVEIKIDDKWLLFDAREIDFVDWDRVIIMQRGDEPLLDVFGGQNSQVSFSTLKDQRSSFTTALASAQRDSNPLVDFSIYSLPIAEQNTFKLLLLIPLGALVVVILRNLVGIQTSGTFMPVLIALSFLQTSLILGIVLFVLVVGVGLIMRSYLSRLNLLLVPRIASVLVFVIIIYAAIGILSFKMGWDWGLKVTFFPMIILSWTIERMSILWDEEGGHEVFIQSVGSLLTASLAYLLMSNSTIADTIFLFPEILLIVLAVIIAIGSYSGYRLSDLRRFEPMERL
tara:strand:- start:5916 stop:7448 length:1533 start_codon:yes stop_codon:yes gene_type:complete